MIDFSEIHRQRVEVASLAGTVEAQTLYDALGRALAMCRGYFGDEEFFIEELAAEGTETVGGYAYEVRFNARVR